MVETHGCRQQGFEGDSTRGGFLEGQALAFLVLRRVHGRDDVDQPAAHCLRYRNPVVFIAQRRLQLEEGPVVRHVQRVERQVVD